LQWVFMQWCVIDFTLLVLFCNHSGLAIPSIPTKEIDRISRRKTSNKHSSIAEFEDKANHTTMSTTTYLITGASSGIGLEFVKQLVGTSTTGTSNHVIATCRKKTSSATGVDLISSIEAAEGNLVTVLEGIDVTTDDCKEKITEGLKAANVETIDVVIHNAGGLGSKDKDSQSIENVTSQIMLDTVNLNGVGPLRVQQALMSKGFMGSGSGEGKVVVITSGMASIGDNNSGGFFAYRSSKAYVNMVTKGMSVDLKPKGIFVLALAPGFVVTEFGGFGKENLAKMGALPVEKSVGQMIKSIDELGPETTGKYMCVDKDGEKPKEYGPGW